jgi:uncharacterized OB-fold protein
MTEEKYIVRNRGLLRAEFNFWVGLYMDKFYDALENKKIIGNKCPECGMVFVPPRKVCGKCRISIPLEENWVDLPDIGTLVNYTLTPYKVNERGRRSSKKLQKIGLVQIDGSDTAIIYKLLDMEEDEIKTGMKLKIKWNDKTKGDPSDIKGFIKAGGE